MARLFDAYIIVDWSASSKPVRGANSIWIAICAKRVNGAYETETLNPSTRLEARQLILDHADGLIERGEKVLLGFDFAMGYPTGTAEALGLPSTDAPWRAMQTHLSNHTEAAPDNSNTRFELAAEMNAAMTGTPHPFWGATKTKVCETLSMKKGDFSGPNSISESRTCETWIKANFKATPKSVWQLTGVGSVGSQALLGIPTVAFLRDQIPHSKIWPFETGFEILTPSALENTSCVLAEIYPSTVEIALKTGEILDQAQVRTLSERFELLDSAGNLASAFGPPDSISDREIHKITAEEGWILAK